jgi:hypothetical protein
MIRNLKTPTSTPVCQIKPPPRMRIFTLYHRSTFRPPHNPPHAQNKHTLIRAEKKIAGATQGRDAERRDALRQTKARWQTYPI